MNDSIFGIQLPSVSLNNYSPFIVHFGNHISGLRGRMRCGLFLIEHVCGGRVQILLK